MADLLIIAFDPSEVASAAGFAQASGLSFDVFVCGAGEVAGIGAGSVRSFGLAELPPADSLASGLQAVAGGYSLVASVSSMRSKEVLARLAGLVDAPMVTDITGMHGPREFVRPIVAGAMLETVQVSSSTAFVTFRPSGFAKVASEGAVTPETVAFSGSGTTTITAKAARSGGRPDLTQAKVIISGGRPLKDAATFEQVIGGFADAVGGAAGATRAAVDSGIAANELQVGQTGKIVAPDLYIAAGISGSTQHMAGIKDSKIIVAINTDADAPIFDIADLGLVMDLYAALPELQAKMKK